MSSVSAMVLPQSVESRAGFSGQRMKPIKRTAIGPWLEMNELDNE